MSRRWLIFVPTGNNLSEGHKHLDAVKIADLFERWDSGFKAIVYTRAVTFFLKILISSDVFLRFTFMILYFCTQEIIKWKSLANYYCI